MKCPECKKDVAPWTLGTYDDTHAVAWLRCPSCRYAWPERMKDLPRDLRRDTLDAEQSRLAVEGLI
jgi:DNA-directed RNA polymerase subunit RPC12/RpoP